MRISDWRSDVCSSDLTITVADGGLAAFVAPHVSNDGVIHARLGRVELAAGSAVTLDLYGDRLVEIAVGGKSSATGALVENAGAIVADGGRITLDRKRGREGKSG